jgi:hypothetical protein
MFAPTVLPKTGDTLHIEEEGKVADMSELILVIKHFPMHELTVRRLFFRSKDFRSLCSDYEAVGAAVERWGPIPRYQDTSRSLEMNWGLR